MTDLTQIDVSGAKLPSTYHAAKRAISQCASLDECKDWSDKAAALASYAKQAQDDQLEQMAKRIRARATRRAGELLKQIEPGINRHTTARREGTHTPSRVAAATEAGMSKHQAVQAMRVANVPEDQFENLVEHGATVTSLAEMGVQSRSPNRDEAKSLIAAIRAYAERLSEIDLDEAVYALDQVQSAKVRMLIGRIDGIHDKVVTSL